MLETVFRIHWNSGPLSEITWRFFSNIQVVWKQQLATVLTEQLSVTAGAQGHTMQDLRPADFLILSTDSDWINFWHSPTSSILFVIMGPQDAKSTESLQSAKLCAT